MAHSLSFATFNLYNLQLPSIQWRRNSYTQGEYNKKVDWTAKMLGAIDANVIAFQELWSRQCLVDVFEAAGLETEYTLHFIKDDSNYSTDHGIVKSIFVR